ncbi:RAP1-like protein, GTPase exchange factor, Zfs1 target number 1 [Schizosaccharomyces osmophilus]|uniref:RAP1-like protein, GTPase exchange factor, Zfs1 target number 1 n=1 Tax=Schizosaccharomyces osmophilus TaxID=2545709 RepID=A0AAE9WIV9_9SCHI|nr:RAP1-like protein, GTPase exchange factor, Zfs1 target number 1 [Schizosaccharomyces osmophilus]WBW74993.1 RAP1-like protein, GTPase exchange factor, Zfs1 target number 1 [Schizosaccharomyces osmophilus]
MTIADDAQLYQTLADRSKNADERLLLREYIPKALDKLMEISLNECIHKQCLRFLANSCSEEDDNRATFFDNKGLDMMKIYCAKADDNSALAFAVIHNCILDSKKYQARVAETEILHLAITYWIDWQHKLRAPFINMLSVICELLYPFSKDATLVFAGLHVLPSMTRLEIDSYSIFTKAFDNPNICISFANDPDLLIESIELVLMQRDFSQRIPILNLFPRIAEHNEVFSTSLHQNSTFLDYLKKFLLSDDSARTTMAALFIGNLTRNDHISKALFRENFPEILVACVLKEKRIDDNVGKIYACSAALRHFMIPLSSRNHFAARSLLLQDKMLRSSFSQLHYLSVSMIRLSMPYILYKLIKEPERFDKLRECSKSPDANLALESNRAILAFMKHALIMPNLSQNIRQFLEKNIAIFHDSVLATITMVNNYPIVTGEAVFVAILMIKHGFAGLSETIRLSSAYEILKSYSNDPKFANELKQNILALLVLVDKDGKALE